MNKKPFFEQVVAIVGETQDGNKISDNDVYGKLLITLIKNNTERNANAKDNRQVDTQELASNLRYAIHEFSKALQAVEKFHY